MKHMAGALLFVMNFLYDLLCLTLLYYIIQYMHRTYDIFAIIFRQIYSMLNYVDSNVV